MKIIANSKEYEIIESTTVGDFIKSMSINPAICVVELNSKAMRYDMFKDIILNDGDILEIMQIVAGG